MTTDDALPDTPTCSVKEAGAAFGASGSSAYEMSRRGDFERLGIKVLRIGERQRVVTADVRRVLGLGTEASQEVEQPQPRVPDVADYVDALVRAAPPLSPEQRERLRHLLSL